MIDSFKMKQPKDFVCLVAGKPPVPAQDTNKTTTEFKPEKPPVPKTQIRLLQNFNMV